MDLVLSFDGVGVARAAEIQRELAMQLARQAGISVEEEPAAAIPGSKAIDGVVVGQLLVAILSASATTALVNCLRAWIARDESIIFRLKRADGSELSLDAKRLSDANAAELLKQIRAWLALT